MGLGDEEGWPQRQGLIHSREKGDRSVTARSRGSRWIIQRHYGLVYTNIIDSAKGIGACTCQIGWCAIGVALKSTPGYTMIDQSKQVVTLLMPEIRIGICTKIRTS